jgi:hypothetical protein
MPFEHSRIDESHRVNLCSPEHPCRPIRRSNSRWAHTVPTWRRLGTRRTATRAATYSVCVCKDCGYRGRRNCYRSEKDRGQALRGDAWPFCPSPTKEDTP